MPPVALLPAALKCIVYVTVSKQQYAASVMYDPRDAKIVALETSLQSLQSSIKKLQTTTASTSLQQRPPPPGMHSLPQQYALPAALLYYLLNRIVG